MRGPRLSRSIVLSLGVVLAASTGTALGQGATDPNIGQGGRPDNPFTDRTRAEFTLQAVNQTVRQCVSTNDGPLPPTASYADIQTDYQGRTESDDPRLSGDIEVNVRALVRQVPDDGPILPDFGQDGLAEARFKIKRDDGRITAGRSFLTIGGTDTANTSQIIEGVAFGRAQDTPGPKSPTTDEDFEGGDLIGNLNAEASPPFGQQVTGSFGEPGGPVVGDEEPDNDEQPAFIQDGHCTGKPTQTVG